MQERMKVLWLCSGIPPQIRQREGMEEYPFGGWVSALLERLQREPAIRLFLLFPQPADKPLQGEFGNVRYRSALFTPCGQQCDPAVCHRFFAVLQEEKPDVVHVFGTEYASTLSMVLACEKLGMLDRVIVHIQGLAHVTAHVFYSALPPKVQLQATPYERFRGQTLQRAKKDLIQRGELEKQTIQKLRHVFGRTVWDRACVYDLNAEAKYHECPEILRAPFYTGQWRQETCDRHSLFAVAEHPVKGLPYLLQALPIIRRKYPDVRLRVAGWNHKLQNWDWKSVFTASTYHRYIRRELLANGLSEQVAFIGLLDAEQMKAEYLKANAFVLPSVIENESNTLSEAKMLGVPCVAAYVGGAVSRIEHGVDGYQYPSAEPEMLAYYICRLFEDVDNAVAMGQRAREKTLALCDPERVTETVLGAYRELAGQDKDMGTGNVEQMRYGGGRT